MIAKGKKNIPIDVMNADTDMFICTLKFPYNPLFKLKESELMDFVFEKRPTLRYGNIRVLSDSEDIDLLCLRGKIDRKTFKL